MSVVLMSPLSKRTTQTGPGEAISTIEQRGRLRIAIGHMDVAVTDVTVGNKWMFCALPSNGVLAKAEFASTGFQSSGSTFTARLGLYDDPEGLVQVKQVVYANSIQLNNPSTRYVDYSMEADGRRQRVGDFVWQDADLAEDPQKELFLGFDIVNTPTVILAGVIGFRVTWAVD